MPDDGSLVTRAAELGELSEHSIVEQRQETVSIFTSISSPSSPAFVSRLNIAMLVLHLNTRNPPRGRSLL
jgi:hypothetical protein